MLKIKTLYNPLLIQQFSAAAFKHLPVPTEVEMDLKLLGLAKGFGLREFALTADMEYSQLSKIERGVTTPTLNTMLNLCVALKVTHQELFDFKFEIPKT